VPVGVAQEAGYSTKIKAVGVGGRQVGVSKYTQHQFLEAQ
jgi:hypothetical protein